MNAGFLYSIRENYIMTNVYFSMDTSILNCKLAQKPFVHIIGVVLIVVLCVCLKPVL